MSRLESEQITKRFPLKKENKINPSSQESLTVQQLPKELLQQVITDFDNEARFDELKNIGKESQEKEGLYYARVLIKNQEYSLAQKLLRKILHDSPCEMEAIRLLGRCHQAQGQFEEA